MAAPAAAAVLLDSGARILQYRLKGHFSRGHLEEAEAIGELCRSAGARFVVNDRADIARLLNAGLHLGQDDLPPREARKQLGAEAPIGLSTHNEAQLRAALEEPADYLALGPIFATGSKENPDPVVGVDQLRRLRPLTSRPLAAIGGIRRETAQAVLDAGADSIAVIGDLFPEPCTLSALRARAEQWQELLNR